MVIRCIAEIEQGLKSVSGNSCLDQVIKDKLFKLTYLYVVYPSRYKYAYVHAKLFVLLCIGCYGPSVWINTDVRECLQTTISDFSAE